MHKNQDQMHLPYAQRSAIIAFMQKEPIKKRLDHLIKLSGKRPTEIARHAGVSQSTLSRILSGKIEHPSDRQIEPLAKYFGVSGDQVRGYEPLHTAKKTDRPLEITSSAELIESEIVEGNEPLRPDEVWLPLLREVEFAAGCGATQVVENHGAQERFSIPRLSRAGVQPQNAALAIAKGDSMMPAIHDGATLGIDKGCQHVIDGKVFVLDHGGMLRVKRLYRMPLNRIRVVSDNNIEYPEEIYSLGDPDAPKILGRVFWWENFD